VVRTIAKGRVFIKSIYLYEELNWEKHRKLKPRRNPGSQINGDNNLTYSKVIWKVLPQLIKFWRRI
jgi:hypothetical protein